MNSLMMRSKLSALASADSSTAGALGTGASPAAKPSSAIAASTLCVCSEMKLH
jgi:hypothetical protein